MFCILGHKGAWAPISKSVWFYWFSCRRNRKNRLGATLILFFLMRKQIHSTICHVALCTFISAENLVAPPPPSAAGTLFKYFPFKKPKKPRVLGKKPCFSALSWNHAIFVSLHLFIGKTYVFEHRKLTKKTYFAMSYWISKKGSRLTILSVGFLSNFQ